MKFGPTRTLLRWHGGKWILAPWIIGHFPKHRVYTEVYGGAASVLLRKPRSYAEIYNDLDGEVVNLFQVLRDREGGAMLKEKLKLTPFSRVEFRNAHETTNDPVESARRLVVRSFMGHGSTSSRIDLMGGFRANSNRSGTTPAHDWANYSECLDGIIERLSGVIIENRPALEILKQHDGPQTLHYVDPPYPHESRRPGQKKNYSHEMTNEDHEEMESVLKRLKGMVVLSGYQCPLYSCLFSEWKRVDRKAMADGARERTESLWFNAAAWEQKPQGVLL